jgi:ABC-2 type transport system permease protein
MAIVLGKVLGGTVLAFAQGLLFLLLAPTIGIHLSVASLAMSMLVMLIVSFALTALGFCIAWRMSSTQGFHAIMNLFLMPMWFLSGALFPPGGAAGPLRVIMSLNPLTYGLIALRHAIHFGDARDTAGPSLAVSLGLSVVFAVVMFLLASFVARKTTAADLQ